MLSFLALAGRWRTGWTTLLLRFRENEMALRLIEMILPQEDKKVAHELLKEFKIISVWDEKSSETGFL